MTTGKAILGIVAGMATGVALGILFAPDKGENTRKRIVRGGEDLASALNDKIDEKFNDLVAAITGGTKGTKSKNQKAEATQSEVTR